MGKQFSTPLIVENGEARLLHRIQFEERSFNEDRLQELLLTHPTLLPINEFEPAFGEQVAICRELPTPAGKVDLLYINPGGYMTIVETKLWRNTEARRSVVAQILDYAKEFSRWSYDDLVKAVRTVTGDATGDPLMERVHESDDFDEAIFTDSVSRNLRLGRHLLLIVGDGIREDAEHLVSFLQQAPLLRFTFGLVELGLYQVNRDQPEPILIQPRLLARTCEVTRAVVEVKTTVEPSGIVVTVPETEPPKQSGRKKLSEDLYFEELQKLNCPEATELARWVLDTAVSHDLYIEWGGAGPLLKWAKEETDEGYTFGQLNRKGMLAFTVRLFSQCKRRGVDPQIARDYYDAVAKLIPGASRKVFPNPGGGTKEAVVIGENPRDWPPFAELAARRDEWFAAIDDTVRRLRSATEN